MLGRDVQTYFIPKILFGRTVEVMPTIKKVTNTIMVGKVAESSGGINNNIENLFFSTLIPENLLALTTLTASKKQPKNALRLGSKLIYL